jgi:hypothetical protein
MMLAHEAWRKGKGVDKFRSAYEALDQCKANDWGSAAMMWLDVRREAYLRAHDDGPSHEKELLR